MRKISVGVILVAGVVIALCFGTAKSSRADENAVTQAGNQVINDEGYGNTDEEYNNSENEMVNDEESSGPRENAAINSTGNNAQ